jgi:hypothetical protein
MWRSTERASLEKKLSTRLSQERSFVIVENEHVDFAVDAGRRKNASAPGGAQQCASLHPETVAAHHARSSAWLQISLLSVCSLGCHR